MSTRCQAYFFTNTQYFCVPAYSGMGRVFFVHTRLENHRKGSDISMEQAIVARPRTGWNSEEEALLQRAVDRCRAAGEPLRAAFMEAARETGRRPNSVRNHYYSSSKTAEAAPAFLPFSEEESLSLLKTVLLARSAGESVRSCTLRIAEGDTRRMLRYQNKYRALLKSRPALVDRARRELQAGGDPIFDPYAPTLPGPGRPRKASHERDTEVLIRTLCESLGELLRRSAKA